MKMRWVRKSFDELSKEELYRILMTRVAVFVVEQACPYPEVDGRDQDSLHLWLEVDGEIAAYCRIISPENVDGHYTIGRVLVTEDHRGKGYARAMMTEAVRVLEEEWKVGRIFLHGQEHLRHFYGSFGFEEISDVYLEDGIPHVDMIKQTAGG